MDTEKVLVWGLVLWVLYTAWTERDSGSVDFLPPDTSRDPCSLPDPQAE
jgi:hypothetical protein